MADSTPVAAVQSDGDQWIAALRAEILDGDKMSALVAGRMAHIIRDQHPDQPGIGRVIIDAAVAALSCRAWLERKAPGKPVTADAFANLIGLAGIALIDQEEDRNG
jgi:hypothetical protein